MITLIGLGAGDSDSLSRGAERALRQASADYQAGTGTLFLRTARHPVVTWLQSEGLTFDTFDALYDAAADFADVYSQIAQSVLNAAQRQTADGTPYEVAYAVPGHPLFGEHAAQLILDQAQQAGISTQVISSGSFVEAVFTALGVSLDAGCDIRDALTLQTFDSIDSNGNRMGARLDVTRSLLLFQVYDSASASHAKLALMRDYPDDWEVRVVQEAGVADRQQVRPLPLFRLDREPVRPSHLPFMFRPCPLAAAARILPNSSASWRDSARPDGCPWDREQTHATLKKYFVEETYEVLDAIDAYNAGSPPTVC